MEKFSLKRFFITLGLAIGVWVISGLIQAFTKFNGNFNIFDYCHLTGYPLALCISGVQQEKLLLIYLINIIFWYWVFHFLLRWIGIWKKE